MISPFYPKGPKKMDLSQGFPELPSGPLDVYRKRASFNWKEMLRFLEGEEIIAFKVTGQFSFYLNAQFKVCVCVCTKV